ncbi:D-Ala-D-Ala carboxypeptidase family metallohydrolase [Microbulbifer sp. MLAF003]|uniref:D-Ala-D-Ala carboxypeptidase family metallohydrolase n=1 Tax=Microbulbifer sp. MLAF003 TaxID=3032582 RepID=UPI0024ADA7E8|nr:D-Ala-D-Ala carboxypeptidase family metallohydrolase [Microbulbifer sp. MLAF003]WHI52966.1 D-Ala-D-Ala carboxypeptidase family metallohydrolase [Microbulbifer sp. MLAF003]
MFKNDYFTESELACRCCGKNHFKDETLRRLIRVRGRYGRPMIINSGYRCPAHNARLNATITHTTGQAVDVSVAVDRAHELMKVALEEGFSGIGVKQKGPIKKRFIHLDDLDSIPGERVRPTVWSY